MGKFRSGSRKGFAAAVAAGLLVAAVAVFVIGCRQTDRLDGKQEKRESGGNGQIREEHERGQSAEKSTLQAAASIPENPLQIILSLGAEPGQLSISWKGDADGSDTLQIEEGEADGEAEADRSAGAGALQKDEAGNTETAETAGDSETAGAGQPGGRKVFAAKKERILKSDYYRWHVSLTGLSQGREYRYQIGELEGSFRVPQERETTKFLYLGDVQFQDSVDEYEEWGAMVEEAYRAHPDLDFAVIGGDLVNSPGELAQWEAFLNACDVFAGLPVMTVAGNHEGVQSNYTYQKIFALPDDAPRRLSGEEFYAFDFGNTRFLMLDSSFLTEERKTSMGLKRWKAEEQRVEDWIRQEAQTCEKPWLAAVIHHPVYGMHDGDTVSPQIRKLWEPLLQTGGVKVVFSGHQHLYQRTKSIRGVTYLMGNSGRRESCFFDGNNLPEYTRQIYDRGPNYQIVEASSKRLKLTSYNQNGLVIDETVLGRGLLFHILEFFRGGQVVV